jgi:hypothetical protein
VTPAEAGDCAWRISWIPACAETAGDGIGRESDQLTSRWFETTPQEVFVTGPESIQMERYNSELEDDMRHILEKYPRIMGWSIPKLDEGTARRLILEAKRSALAKVENE